MGSKAELSLIQRGRDILAERESDNDTRTKKLLATILNIVFIKSSFSRRQLYKFGTHDTLQQLLTEHTEQELVEKYSRSHGQELQHEIYEGGIVAFGTSLLYVPSHAKSFNDITDASGNVDKDFQTETPDTINVVGAYMDLKLIYPRLSDNLQSSYDLASCTMRIKYMMTDNIYIIGTPNEAVSTIKEPRENEIRDNIATAYVKLVDNQLKQEAEKIELLLNPNL